MLQESKEYVHNRLNAELAFASSVQHIIKQYASIIANIAFQYRMQPRFFAFRNNRTLKAMVDRHLKEMKEEIYNYIITYCTLTNKKTKEKDVVAWLSDDNLYSTFKDKLDEYIAMWSAEIEKHIAAALIEDVSAQEMVREYNPLRPYTATFYKNAEKEGSFALDLKNHGKRGVGKTTSGTHAITVFGRDVVAKWWMKEWADKWRKKNVTLYNVYRGSSYPCDLCDSMVGIQTEDNLPPYHPNCCCIAVPILNE